MYRKSNTEAEPIFNDKELNLPKHIKIEQAVLGAMLLEEDSRNIVCEKIKEHSTFYYPNHQQIFKSIVELTQKDNSEIDIFSVSHLLNSSGFLTTIGGEDYLLELQNSIATTANIESWCSILIGLQTLRKMISICTSTINKCCNCETENVSEMLAEIESEILSVRNTNESKGLVELKCYVKGSVKHFENLSNKELNTTGISTGFVDIDKIIMGLKKSEMIVLAARPSIGKTALALNITTHIAINKKLTVAFFSLEMSAEQLTRRILCSMAEISEQDFINISFTEAEFTKKWQRFTQSASILQNNANIVIDPTPGISINELRAKAVRYNNKNRIDIIVIDYLQLMRANVNRNDNRQIEVAKISAGIKALAKELNIPILVLAQLNRQAELSDRPKLSHLRESGTIEQDADIVMFLHRERDQQKDLTLQSVDAEVIVEKNRNGQTGIAKLLFFPKYVNFTSKSRYGDLH